MAISFDNQYIYIGHDASQTLAIYNLDDFSRLPDVSTGAGNGNVVRSLAVASNRSSPLRGITKTRDISF